MTKRTTNPEKQRKRRPDAWEVRAGLTEAQLAQVYQWANSLGYRRARALVEKELKVDAALIPNDSNFGAWYEMYSRQVSESRIHRAIVDSGAVRDLAEKTGDVSQAMCSALEAEAAAAILGNDPARIKLLVGLALKARNSQFDERKYKDAMKTSIEKGLDELAKEVEGNPEALELYQKFRAAVLKSAEEAKA